MLIIGVAGGTASGKSTLARRIVELLGADQVAFVSQDWYFIPLQQPPEHHINGGPNYDHPSAMDFPLMREHLAALREGRGIVAPEYEYSTSARSTTRNNPVAARPVVVFEGIHALHDGELRALMDKKVFVYLDADLRLIRRIKRDIVERGMPMEKQLHWYVTMVKPMHDQFIEPARAHADLQIHGETTEEGAQMIAALARQWIAENCGAKLEPTAAAAVTP